MNSRKKLLGVFAIFGTLGLAGCGGQSGDSNTATGPAAGALTEVKVGYTPTIVLPQPLVGVKSDYAKLIPGVSFIGKDYEAGPAILDNLRAGAIDIGASGPLPAIKGYSNSKDIVILSGCATGGTQLMVAKTSTYKTVADLKGKKIAVNQLGSTVDTIVRFNLIKAGLVPNKDVTIKEIKPNQQASALKRNEVAAIAAPAPWPSFAAITADARPLVGWKEIFDNGNYLAGSIYTTKKFAEAHPDFIKQFVAANQTITDRLNKDRKAGDAEVLLAWSEVSKKELMPEVAADAFKTIVYTMTADQKGLQAFADAAFEAGTAREKTDLSGIVFKAP